MVILTMPLALESSAKMGIDKIQIQSCANQGDICLTVKSPKAQVAALSPIYFMNDVEVEAVYRKNIANKVVPKVQTYKTGYLDFDSNQLVLQKIDKNGFLTEEVYNLTTLKKNIFVMR